MESECFLSPESQFCKTRTVLAMGGVHGCTTLSMDSTPLNGTPKTGKHGQLRYVRFSRALKYISPRLFVSALRFYLSWLGIKSNGTWPFSHHVRQGLSSMPSIPEPSSPVLAANSPTFPALVPGAGSLLCPPLAV